MNDAPLTNVGLQDITAHVDFTAVAEVAQANQLDVNGFCTLAHFLINCGLTEFVQPGNPNLAHEINILTSPAEMGELFKVILLTKDAVQDLVGFTHFDRRHTL